MRIYVDIPDDFVQRIKSSLQTNKHTGLSRSQLFYLNTFNAKMVTDAILQNLVEQKLIRREGNRFYPPRDE